MSALSRRPLSAAAMDREDAGDADPAALRMDRRKLGQSRNAAELPKKSGYLLKKGPLKVNSHMPCVRSDVSGAHGGRARRKGLVDVFSSVHCCSGLAKTLVRVGTRRAIVLPIAPAGRDANRCA